MKKNQFSKRLSTETICESIIITSIYASEDPQIPKTLRARNCPLSFSNS